MKRLRGRKLQERRKRLLMRRPLCVHCQAQGRVTAATVLDHVVALINGGTDTEDNLQPLCDECHRLKTAADTGKTVKVQTGLDGWPVGGSIASKGSPSGNRSRCHAVGRL
jgi:5-methylcytosine-specific restriction enzyme A